MKRIIVAFLLILNICIAYGASDKTITSKTYVDNQLATKQDKIPAVDTKTVITHTGSAGEIGEKGIYDSTNNYAEQQTSLVTAGDANTGINNALENEFVCVDEDTDSTCLLWSVKNEFNPSKNLFNKNDSKLLRGYWFSFDSSKVGLNFYSADRATSSEMFISAPIAVEPNHTYTMSNYKSDSYSMANPSFVYLDENFIIIGGFKNGSQTRRTFTVPNNANIKYVVTPGHVPMLDVAQLEEGSTATSYQPYGNTYIPSGN